MSPWIPRVLLALAVVGVAAGIYSIAVGDGGPQAEKIGGVNEVQRLFGGIPQSGDELGDGDAETLVSVFNDLQCTDCATWQIEEIDPLIEKYVRTDEIRMEFRHFASGAKATTLGAAAAEAAGLQDYQWQYIDTFLRNQDEANGRVDDEFLLEIAGKVPNLEVEIWQEDFDSEEASDLVDEDALLATELELPGSQVGTSSAPLQEYGASVVVSGPEGQRRLEDFPDTAEIEAAIEAVSGA